MKTFKLLIISVFILIFFSCHFNYNTSITSNRVVKSHKSSKGDIELSCMVNETRTERNLNQTTVTELLIVFKTPEISISEKINSKQLSEIIPKLNTSSLRIDSVSYSIPAAFSPAEIHLHFILPPDRVELSFPVTENSGKWALDKKMFTLKLFELQN